MKQLIYSEPYVLTKVDNDYLTVPVKLPLKEEDIKTYGFTERSIYEEKNSLIYHPMDVEEEISGPGKEKKDFISMTIQEETEDVIYYEGDIFLENYYTTSLLVTDEQVIEIMHSEKEVIGNYYEKDILLNEMSFTEIRAKEMKNIPSVGLDDASQWEKPFDIYIHDEVNIPSYEIDHTPIDVEAEVVTVVEELDKTPQMIAVSQVFNEETQGEKEVDFSQGILTDVEVVDGKIQISSIDGITYSSSGFYESPTIDLGDNIKSLYKVESLLDIPEGTKVTIYTSTSTDGISFSEYLPLNMDGTIASPSGRYVKVKAELLGEGEEKERVIYDFTEEERNAFQENEMVEFNGAARLKTSFVEKMEVDDSFVGEGTLLRKKINKSKIKVIEKVGVE